MLMKHDGDTVMLPHQDIAENDEISIKDLYLAFRRHLRLILLFAVLGLAAGITYLLIAKPIFTATASILIDPTQQNVVSSNAIDRYSLQENFIIDSEIEVMRSTRLMKRAAEKARILDQSRQQDVSFLSSIRSKIFQAIGLSRQLNDEELKRAKVANFSKNVNISRVGRTFVINISFSSSSSSVASRLANVVAETYLSDELEAQYESVERTNNWLRQRLIKLQNEIAEAERAIEIYKEEHDIVETSDSKNITDQQLSELNSRLILARTESAQAEARYKRIEEVVTSRNPDQGISEALTNETIKKLRTDFVQISRRAIEIERRHGSTHLAFRNLQRQMSDIEALIIDEYRRIGRVYKNEYEIAESRQRTLEKELSELKNSTIFTGRRSQIELRKLQRRADSSQAIYRKMLDKFNELNESQSVPTAKARIINYAEPPNSPSKPRKSIVLALTLMLGIILGCGIAFVKEMLNRYIWDAQELENTTGHACLGHIPIINLNEEKIRSQAKKIMKRQEREASSAQSRNFELANNAFNKATTELKKPSSPLSEILRNVELTIRSDAKHNETTNSHCMSFVSARPGEGKSSISMMFARYLSSTGSKTVLLDCDFRRPRLTSLLCPEMECGLYELIVPANTDADDAQRRTFSDILVRLDEENTHFVPAKGKATKIESLNFITSGQLSKVIAKFKESFDYVIVDLPPISSMVDARALSTCIDQFFFVTEWGKTSPDQIRSALASSPEVYEKLKGCLLTKVDVKKASAYGYYHYNSYYYN